jgi:hypothetical protein
MGNENDGFHRNTLPLGADINDPKIINDDYEEP